MNNAIVSRTVTGPGLKSRPPMATYISEPSQRAIIRAKNSQAGQRIDRDRREAMALLRALESADGPLLQQLEPKELPPLDPVLNADFLAGLIAGAAVVAVVAGALLIGNQL
jgi:hypothetical protein